MRTLIVDDERLARQKIRTLLASHPDVEIIGECKNGLEAVEAIRAEKPELVFLDIQMPGLDGFEVLTKLDGGPLPLFIFVTAHNQHAIRAFDVNALDYLLKPFERSRFEMALQRVRERLSQPRDALMGAQILELLQELRQPSRFLERMLIKHEGRSFFVKTVDIEWIEAADNYVSIHTRKESHLIRETMAGLEKQLDPGRFVRVHRSAIVNIDSIQEIRQMFHGDYAILLTSGREVPFGRAYRDRLRSLSGK